MDALPPGWTPLTTLVERLHDAVEEGATLRHDAGHIVVFDPQGAATRRVQLPLAARALPPTDDTGRVLAFLARPCPRDLVVLFQAGAAALGFWNRNELFAHKVFRRYVVRGNGKAQPTHLRTRGKSRYGSRLRLRNARRLLDEVGDRARTWAAELGPPRRIFYACTARTWGTLREALGAVAEGADEVVKVPRDCGPPGYDELLRVRRFLEGATVEAVEDALA